MNLPPLVRVWFVVKWWTADRSSGLRVVSDKGPSSTSQNLRSVSSPVAHEIWQVAIWGTSKQDLVEPASTQPKHVLKAIGVPGGPLHRPWRITFTKISIPRSISIFPGQPNPGSARSIPLRWFHSFFQHTWREWEIARHFRYNDSRNINFPEGWPDRRNAKISNRLTQWVMAETSYSWNSSLLVYCRQSESLSQSLRYKRSWWGIVKQGSSLDRSAIGHMHAPWCDKSLAMNSTWAG